MKSFIARSRTSYGQYHDNCPYCGFFSLEPKEFPEHMNKKHPSVGLRWELSTSGDPKTSYSFDVIHLVREDEKDRALKKIMKDKKNV